MSKIYENEPLKIEAFMTNRVNENLRFFVALGSPEVRNSYLEVLAVAFPEEHKFLIKEMAKRVALGQLDLTVTARCQRCQKYHDSRTLC